MNKKVISFGVQELLSDNNRYSVPMYQRNYAWGEGEIHQLIQDVLDMQEKHQGRNATTPYYLGTLVVFQRSDGSLEVIDGQQRFTTLTLMAICLKRLVNAGKEDVAMDWFGQPNLEFESRPKSSHTLTCLTQGQPLDSLRNEDCNPDLLNGFALLEKHLMALGHQLQNFCDYLFDKVQITRVLVPEDTNLNHYFEVMNSRGEQLEKHEVIKARLMSVLYKIEDKEERDVSLYSLVKIWDATANMESYVQYGFTTKQRHQIFGDLDWGQFKPADFTELCQMLAEEGQQGASDHTKTLHEILAESPVLVKTKSDTGSPPERFNSVINFSNFLLHVLRIWTGEDIPLDDKRLIDQFDEYVLRSGSIKKVQNFAFSLLKSKYLFDQYIIKREFSDGGDQWSLKRLRYYNDKSQSYINSFDIDREDGFEGISRRILMLLSALHVSTPTMVYKHWLNGALYALYQMETVVAPDYLEELENLARQFVFGRYLSVMGGSAEYYDVIYKNRRYQEFSVGKEEVLELLKYGEIKNNLVFNYLDYLIWRNALVDRSVDNVIKQFEFTFRSSVEHFSPQHPMEGHTPLPDGALHRFGNLCLISHSKNSRLSNYQPKAKRDHFQAAINDKKIDSLKLYKMIRLMDKENGWSGPQINQHEQEMVRLLADDARKGLTL